MKYNLKFKYLDYGRTYKNHPKTEETNSSLDQEKYFRYQKLKIIRMEIWRMAMNPEPY